MEFAGAKLEVDEFADDVLGLGLEDLYGERASDTVVRGFGVWCVIAGHDQMQSGSKVGCWWVDTRAGKGACLGWNREERGVPGLAL